MSEKVKSIEARLSDAAKAIGHGIAQRAQNDHHGYSYTSAAAVNRTVGAALSAEGVTVSVRFEILPPSSFAMIWLRAIVTYRSEGGTMETEGLGAGKQIKGGEKALLKAQSVAVKYAHVHTMKLGMGEDPEADDEAAFEKHGHGTQGGPDWSSDTQALVSAYESAKTRADFAAAKEMKDAAWPSMSEADRLIVTNAFESAWERSQESRNGK